MIHKGLITLLMLSSIACNAAPSDTIKKEAAAAKARQDKYSQHPEWHKKKISLLTQEEAAEWETTNNDIDRLDDLLTKAEKERSDVYATILTAHGLKDYPARWSLSDTPAVLSEDGECYGSIDLLDDNSQTYILYTPGGMACYLGFTTTGSISNGGGVIFTSPDVEDKR